jgi:hypothetical protein
VLLVLSTSTVLVAGQQSEREPNNNMDEANSIDTGETVNAQLSGAGSLSGEGVDWFKFEADKGDAIQLSVEDLQGQASIIDSEGNTLNSNSPFPDQLSANAEQAETYYVKFELVPSYVNTYNYSFRVTTESETASQNSTEPNTSTATTTSSSQQSNEGDQFNEICREASTFSATSVQTGAINTPKDKDVFSITLKEGEYVTVTPLIPESEGEVQIVMRKPYRNETYSFHNVNLEDGVSKPNYQDKYHRITSTEYNGGIQNSSLELWAETDITVCFAIKEESSSKATIPYQWRIELSKNSPNTGGDVSQPENDSGFDNTTEKAVNENQRITELENQVNRLEARLEEKNRTIQRLRQQLNATDSGGGDVSIDVSVSPGQNQQGFVAGGSAVVEASSTSGSVAGLEVQLGNRQYTFNRAGQIEIPLQEAGTQEMVFRYQDTVERMSLDVQSQSQEDKDTSSDTSTEIDTATETGTEEGGGTTSAASQNDATTAGESGGSGGTTNAGDTGQQDSGTETTGATGPGFTPIATITAILLTAVVLLRRNRL